MESSRASTDEPDIGSHPRRMVRKARLQNEPASTAISLPDRRFTPFTGFNTSGPDSMRSLDNPV